MPPVHVQVGGFIGVLIASWQNRRAWRIAERSMEEAITAWGGRIQEQDAREDRMMRLAERQARLAERQVRLGWLSLGVATMSAVVAVIALVAA
jgi:ABC-type uncharacterized transport system fused permease/ATPase subunit